MLIVMFLESDFSKPIAGNDGLREAAKKAKPVILEPIMG